MAAFEAGPGARLGDWVLLRPGGAAEWEESWLAQDGNGALGVVYLLRRSRGVSAGRLAAVRHPALVEVVGGGEQPVSHVVRERVGGKPLAAYMMSGAAPEGLAISIAAQIASGLAALHAEGLHHGLLADSRVLVESIREPRVLLVGQGLAGERWQGGLDYAAPECVRGAPSSPAADVYALGLLLWQLTHGRLPWAEHGRSQAMLRRGRERPRSLSGPPALRALVERCLSLGAEDRPTALEVVRELEALGGRLAPPDGLHLKRRARAITVLNPGVRKELDRWLESGGRLGLEGPSGSGRTRLLDALSTALRVRGMPYVRIGTGAHAWDPIEHALSSPGLPGPPVPLPEWAAPGVRPQVAALALAQRAPGGFHVLVDDYDLLDGPSRECLACLSADERAHLCLSAREAPGWVQRRCELAPWRREQVHQLVRGVLGEVEGSEALGDRLWTVAGGVPGPTIQRLLALVQAGALRWDALRWRLVEERLPRALQDTTVPDDPLGGLGTVARRLGSFLVLVGHPCTVEYLCHLAGVEEEEGRICVRELIHAGLARVEHRQILPRNSEALTVLGRAGGDLGLAHQRLLAQQLDLPDAVPARLGWYLLGARDRAAILEHGAAAMDAASRRDPSDGARLADGLWELAPQGPLVLARMRALAQAGRVSDALALGQGQLHRSDPDPVPAKAEVLATMAWIHSRLPGHGAKVAALAERCRAEPGGAPSLLDHAEACQHFADGDLPAAVLAARRVADREPPSGDGERLDRWLTLRALWARALHRSGSLDLAIGVLEPLPRQLGHDRPARAVLDGLLGSLLLEAGRFADAVTAMEQALRRDSGLPPVARACLMRDIGTARRVLGSRDLALQQWRTSLALLERVGAQRQGLEVLVALARCLRELGRSEEAEAAARLCHDRASKLDEPAARARAAIVQLEILATRGDLDGATLWLDRAAEEQGDALSHEAAVIARWRAELALRRRDPRASELLELAAQQARRAHQPALAGVSYAMLAYARVRQGQAVDLDALIRGVLEPMRVAGAGEELAEARLWLAEALYAAGRSEDAEREAGRSLVFAEEMGHLALRGQASAMVKRFGQAQEPEAAQLGQLLELAVAVVREKDTDSLLARIAGSARDLLDAERSFVLLGAEGTMEVVAATSRDGLDPGRPSTSVVNRALREGKEVIAADIAERSDLRDAISVLTLDLGSAMCVPLIEEGVTLGAIYVDSRHRSAVEPATALRLLRALAGYAAVAVSNLDQLGALARQADEAAEIAHDLRSPAASISVLATELLEILPAGHGGRERLRRILDASTRIQEMASAMLRAESVALVPMSLSGLVARSVALEEPPARRAGIGLELDLEPGLEIDGDELSLSRVMSNLVGNAVRHSPEGGVVTVHLSARAGEATCRVSDRGPGIPGGAEEAIFQRGAQVGASPGRRGLGLAIARRIVEHHGGRIEAHSPAGAGAELVFTVPLRVG
jgi:signal transduction histidine kinase